MDRSDGIEVAAFRNGPLSIDSSFDVRIGVISGKQET